MTLFRLLRRQPPSYVVKCAWDDGAQVWYVADSNVPGLATEAPTAEAMMAKLRVMIPELVEENDGLEPGATVPFELLYSRQEVLHFG